MKRFGEIDVCSFAPDGKTRNFEKKKMVVEILCNQCGCQLWECPQGETEPGDDWLGVNHTWNKQSLWEGETHEFHLCQSCYKKISDNFEVKVKPYYS